MRDPMYIVLKKFADLKDNNYIYEIGDEYPRKGYQPDDKRIAELSGTQNKQWTPLIAVKADEPKRKGRKPKN